MTHPLRPTRKMIAVLLTSAFVACDPASEPTAPEASAAGAIEVSASMLTGSPELSEWLADLRDATAPFHRIDAAIEAGWDTPVTECRENPGVGGMGYHYGNLPLIFDGVAEALAPELLLYVPEQNGRLRLVGVEYIVPFDFVPADGPPPSLHGIDFHPSTDDGVWELHAWIWKNNPAGVFEDWNPTVSCAYAA